VGASGRGLQPARRQRDDKNHYNDDNIDSAFTSGPAGSAPCRMGSIPRLPDND